jgi:hypothetical protein
MYAKVLHTAQIRLAERHPLEIKRVQARMRELARVVAGLIDLARRATGATGDPGAHLRLSLLKVRRETRQVVAEGAGLDHDARS